MNLSKRIPISITKMKKMYQTSDLNENAQKITAGWVNTNIDT